jgi:hypothetical protein
MNIDLAKAQIYNQSIQKQVTAWLSLRNSAAHGEYDKYTLEQIKLMNEGIRNFIISYPA